MSPVTMNLSGVWGYVLFWALFALAFGLFLERCVFLVRLLRIGRPEKRSDSIGRRMLTMLNEVLFQRCNLKFVTREDRSGLGHAFMFWGFGLFFISYLVFIGFSAGFGLYPYIDGTPFETVYFSILDIAGICVIIALAWAAVRRYMLKPARLKSSPEAGIILGLVFGLMLLHFLSAGFGYASKGTPDFWPPVSATLANVFTSSGLSQSVLETGYLVTWWLHYAVILGFMVYIPRSKHLHILASPFNLLYGSHEPKGALSAPDLDAEDTVGASRIPGLTWKQMLDLYSCTECGRCHEVCPARQSGRELSPREQVLNLKHHLIETGSTLLKHGLSDSLPGFVGGIVSEEEIWDCVTCRACQEVCPVDIEHAGRIVDIRRDRVLMAADIPAKVRQFYRNIEENSNPWGKAWMYRGNWAEGLSISRPSPDKPAETIFWAGCLGAYDERIQRIAGSISRLLKTAGIDFTILGAEEKCCGDAARRTGNEYLFRELARENIATFARYGVKRIITACPHCYNVFKQEYPQFGGCYEVIHHTHLINDLLASGTINLSVEQRQHTVVYHDPCYLGRYNDIYDPPRRILGSIPGMTMLEKEPCGPNALCCGAGGGAMWMSETGERRISAILLDQVTAKKPDLLATACPYCLTMLENEVREQGLENNLAVKDIAEILQNSLAGK